jgi:hypothetical protein
MLTDWARFVTAGPRAKRARNPPGLESYSDER